MPPSAFPYLPILLRDDEPRCSPMDPGGIGRLFVYITNRNHCTYVFDARPMDRVFHDMLDATFPTGYAQLFVLEKIDPGVVLPAIPGMNRPFYVFQDPARTNVGLGATISFHPDTHAAAVAAKEHRAKTHVATIVVRVHGGITWH